MARPALLAALILSTLVAPASAGKSFSTASDTTTVVGPQGFAKPVCPGGKTPVSGGFEAEFRIGDPAAPAILVTTSRRDQRAWFFAAENQGPGAGTLTGYAYCTSDEVSISFQPLVVPGLTAAVTNTADCRKGTVALSGGYVSEHASIVPYALGRASKRAWAVSATNLGTSEGGLTAYVVCSSRKLADLKLKAVRADAPLAASGSGSTATATANCRAGQRVVSGGFEAPSRASGVLVHRSMRVGKRGWQVAASAQTPAGGTVTAFAYCIPA
jgi:hypothetical protein